MHRRCGPSPDGSELKDTSAPSADDIRLEASWCGLSLHGGGIVSGNQAAHAVSTNPQTRKPRGRCRSARCARVIRATCANPEKRWWPKIFASLAWKFPDALLCCAVPHRNRLILSANILLDIQRLSLSCPTAIDPTTKLSLNEPRSGFAYRICQPHQLFEAFPGETRPPSEGVVQLTLGIHLAFLLRAPLANQGWRLRNPLHR